MAILSDYAAYIHTADGEIPLRDLDALRTNQGTENAGKENSVKGWQGVLKKLGYWLMIMVAFGASAVFVEIGKTLGIDLGITSLLGWFVLASLLINEIRSIVENFVEAGFDVPKILIDGLEVANKVVNKEEEDGD